MPPSAPKRRGAWRKAWPPGSSPSSGWRRARWKPSSCEKNLLQALEPKALEEVLLEELAPLLSEEQVVRAQVEVVLHTGRVIRLD